MFPSLYAIIDFSLLNTSELAMAQLLAKSGVALIQYRNKAISSRSLLQISRKLVAELAPYGTRLIVNDRPDVAALAGAGGVHVGQDDLSPEDARAVCGDQLWVGVSTHNLEQLAAADRTSANYLAFGPIFPTTTKEHPDPVVGPEMLRRARSLTRKPLVAIGGVTLERAAEVYDAGADCIAVARDLVAAPDPGEQAHEYLTLAASIKRAGSSKERPA